MTEPVDKSKLISVSYEEAPTSYLNEELGMSIAPEDALAIAEATSTPAEGPDQYQNSLATLSLETIVEVNVAVRQNEVPPTLQLRALIVEAGRGTPWAVDGLENFLTKSLGLKDFSELNLCFDSCEANVADILMQLRQGDEEQRRAAAQSLLGIILGQPRDAGENLADLKRGLLVAAGQISRETKSDTFYREVAGLNEGQRQTLWVMSHDSRVQPDPKLLLTLKETLTTPEKLNPQQEIPGKDSTPVVLGGGAPVATPGKELAATAIPTAPVATQAISWPNGGLNLIEQILSDTLPRNSEQKLFLQGSPGQPLGQRLAEITQNPRLTPAQISQNLYYAILARGMSHYDFTSAQNHYGELRPVAAQIAGTIMTRLGLASDVRTHLRGDYSSSRPSEGISQIASEKNSLATGLDSRAKPASDDLAAPSTRSLGIFLQPDGSAAPLVGGAVVTSSTVAAGLMSLSFLNLVGNAPQIRVASTASDRPSYFVEGPTTAQGESQGGTGGQSSQGREQDRRNSNPDQVFVS